MTMRIIRRGGAAHELSELSAAAAHLLIRSVGEMLREGSVPSKLQQGCILLLAAALVAAGVSGGQWFMEADYVVFGYLVRSTVTDTGDVGES